MYWIEKATAHPDFTVTIQWRDGAESTVDFKSSIAKGGVFTLMADADFFVEQMQVDEDGRSLGWPGDVDFCADSLWYRTHPEDLERDSGGRVDFMNGSRTCQDNSYFQVEWSNNPRASHAENLFFASRSEALDACQEKMKYFNYIWLSEWAEYKCGKNWVADDWIYTWVSSHVYNDAIYGNSIYNDKNGCSYGLRQRDYIKVQYRPVLS